MSGHNESPRQKMIGMMYLVLTALLALNISKDVLDSFVVVNNGLEQTNANFSSRNDELYAAFDLAKSVNPNRVTPNWLKAQNVKKQSDSLIGFIDLLKLKIISATDEITLEVADTLQMANITNKDNYDITTNIMIGESEDGSAGLSADLKKKLIAFKQQLKDYIEPADTSKVIVDINTNDPINSKNNENWEMYNFYHRPLVASLTILSKMENDIKNAESTVVDYLLRQSDAGNLKFDTVAAKVIPTSNYVLLGEKYQADVFLAAFNKTKNPEIEVENSPIRVNKGVGDYSVQTTREGIFSYEGSIKVLAPSGKEIDFPFKSEYIVAKPALTVSADKMNVLYRNLNNPISVSVPGIPNERLSVSIDNGTLNKLGNGKFIVKPGRASTANVSVICTTESGERKNMGKYTFRVKKVPRPTTKYADKTNDGTITKGELKANKFLYAYYDKFEFEGNPLVTKFEVTVISRGASISFASSNYKMPKGFAQTINSIKRGDKVIFEKVYAKGIDGEVVRLNSLSFKVR